jgi:Holliday junction resolvase RusA-like endonuclease
MKISFTIPGEPKGKQRARTGKGFAYTPKQTVRFESYVRVCFFNKYPNFTPRGGPVRMTVIGYFPVAKSRPKWWKALCGEIEENGGGEGVPFVSAPDWDNVGKIVADALNKIAYDDDRQVFSCLTEQYYSPRPRLEVALEFFDQATKEQPILIPLWSTVLSSPCSP